MPSVQRKQAFDAADEASKIPPRKNQIANPDECENGANDHVSQSNEDDAYLEREVAGRHWLSLRTSKVRDCKANQGCEGSAKSKEVEDVDDCGERTVIQERLVGRCLLLHGHVIVTPMSMATRRASAVMYGIDFAHTQEIWGNPSIG